MSLGLLLRLAACGDPIAARRLRSIQRAIRSDQHILILVFRPILGDPDARRHHPRRIAHPRPDFLHRGAHLLRHAAAPLFTRPYQYHNELVTAIAARHVGQPDVRVDEFRSEEHTSELQSHHDLVCRLLLEKKKNNPKKRVPDLEAEEAEIEYIPITTG